LLSRYLDFQLNIIAKQFITAINRVRWGDQLWRISDANASMSLHRALRCRWDKLSFNFTQSPPTHQTQLISAFPAENMNNIHRANAIVTSLALAMFKLSYFRQNFGNLDLFHVGLPKKIDLVWSRVGWFLSRNRFLWEKMLLFHFIRQQAQRLQADLGQRDRNAINLCNLQNHESEKRE